MVAEKSAGGTADINFKTKITADFAFSINQVFFIQVLISHRYYALMLLVTIVLPMLQKLLPAAVLKQTSNLFLRKTWNYFVDYTYTIAKAGYLTGNRFLRLLPKNKLNVTLMY